MTARKWGSSQDANGQKLVNLGAPTNQTNDAARIVDVEASRDFAISRNNHVGSQLAATITDFNTAVRTNRLDQMTPPTASVSLNAQKIINLLDPTLAQDAATKAYVDALLAALVSGQTIKGTVRGVATTNINTAAAPSTIDGVTPTTGDVFLLTAQTTGSQNGPYVWTAAGASMTRASNWDSQAEAVIGSYWIVTGGSKADHFALLTNDAFTFGTTTAAFTYNQMIQDLIAAVEADVGNGVATSFTIAHNLGTRAVDVLVYRNASPYDEIDVYIEHTDLNNITLRPDVVWATNEFHVVVSKM